MEKVRRPRRTPWGLSRWGWNPVPLEVRLRAVKLYLEEGLPSRLICQELGVHPTVLHAWLKKYREGRAILVTPEWDHNL